MGDLQIFFNHGFHGWHGWQYCVSDGNQVLLSRLSGQGEFSAKSVRGQADPVSVADDIEAFDSLEVLRIPGQETGAVAFGRGGNPEVVV